MQKTNSAQAKQNNPGQSKQAKQGNQPQQNKQDNQGKSNHPNQQAKSGKKRRGTHRGNRNPRDRRQRQRARARLRPQANGAHLEFSDLPLSLETSAGGLVLSGLAEAVRPDGSVDLSRISVALIGRLDRRGRLLWSMPKGHVENDESRAVTAAREVWEETGIEGEVIANLGTIDYWFISDGTRIHKTVHHHLLRFIDGELNDEDPEVTEVDWCPVDELVDRLAYADERRLARRAFDTLPKFARREAEAGRLTPR